jgi:hypothetical protein
LNAVEEVSMTKANMQLFPNPANNLLNIKLPSNETYIAAVYNVSGQIVKSINSSQVGTTSLDISSLAPGVYEVKCISAKGNYISRFVKN